MVLLAVLTESRPGSLYAAADPDGCGVTQILGLVIQLWLFGLLHTT